MMIHKSELLNMYRESFDSNRDFSAGLQNIWFRSRLQNTYREWFDLDQPSEQVHESFDLT